MFMQHTHKGDEAFASNDDRSSLEAFVVHAKRLLLNLPRGAEEMGTQRFQVNGAIRCCLQRQIARQIATERKIARSYELCGLVHI